MVESEHMIVTQYYSGPCRQTNEHTIKTYVDTMNNVKKLAGLKLSESTNKPLWRKKAWRIYPELQVHMDICLIFATG